MPNSKNNFFGKNPKLIDKMIQKEIKRKKAQKALTMLFFTFILLVVFTAGVVAVLKANFFDDEKEAGISAFFRLSPGSSADNLLKRQQNILVLGVDRNRDGDDDFSGTRSDTIIILSIFPQKHSVNLLSIPRDCKVRIPDGHGIQKINAAHALGGVKLTKKTIEQTFGIPINGYIAINTQGVVDLVDALGGVPVYVEKNMRYRDSSGKLDINLTKGEHVLSGKEAEGFLRYRKDALGDIGRTSRQQWFLTALAKKLKSPETITKIPELIKIADKNVKTDLSLYDLSKYAAFATSMNVADIETAVLPGEPNKRGYISYWILDPEKTENVINRMVFNRVDPADEGRTPKAGIISVRGVDVSNLKKALTDAGFEINCTSTMPSAHPQILGQSSLITRDFVKDLKNAVPDLKEYRFVYDLSKNYCPSSDFTIITNSDIKKGADNE
ncbi:MAG: LCP family protein [Candidatus Gastranaerophilaceae bacterium]